MSVSGTESVGSFGSGSFNQTGGSNSASYLIIGSLGRYNFSGGTLQVNGGGFVNQGIFDGGGGAGMLGAANSIIDLSAGVLQNTASMTLSIGPNSLLLVPAGFNPAAVFGSYTNAGLVHVVGTALTVTATQGFSGIGSIADPVICQGTISAAAGNSINLNGGVTVSGSGNVNLGNGSFTVNDAVSGVSGGSLSAFNAYVGDFGAGTFSQSGGLSNLGNSSGGGLYLGYNAGDAGTYVLSGSATLAAYSETVGNFGTGTFTQPGGTNNLVGGFGALVVGNNLGSSGSYTLSGSATLAAYSVTVANSGAGHVHPVRRDEQPRQ